MSEYSTWYVEASNPKLKLTACVDAVVLDIYIVVLTTYSTNWYIVLITLEYRNPLYRNPLLAIMDRYRWFCYRVNFISYTGQIREWGISIENWRRGGLGIRLWYKYIICTYYRNLVHELVTGIGKWPRHCWFWAENSQHRLKLGPTPEQTITMSTNSKSIYFSPSPLFWGATWAKILELSTKRIYYATALSTSHSIHGY